MKKLTNQQIRDICLANGYTIKPGNDDLKPYVYAAARDIEKAATEEPAPKLNSAKIGSAFGGVCSPRDWGHIQVATFGKLHLDQATDSLMMDDFYFLHFGGPLKHSKEIESAKAVYRYVATVAANFNDRIQKDPTCEYARTTERYKVKSFGTMSLDHMGEFKVEGFHLDSKENDPEDSEIPQYVAVLIAIAEYLEKEIKENIENKENV